MPHDPFTSIMEVQYNKVITSDTTLLLRATNYGTDDSGVLHRGIFSRELSSTFLASSVSLIYLLIFSLKSDLDIFNYISALIIFIIAFPLSRMYIFCETYLETFIDRKENQIVVSRKGFLFAKEIKRTLDDLTKIKLCKFVSEPKNEDGVEFVKKIALQHGTIIPGFGEKKVVFSVELLFSNSSISIFSSLNRDKSEKIASKLSDFTGKEDIIIINN